MTVEARRRRLIYFRDGKPESIRVMLRPIGVMPEQLAYLNFVSITILNALKRLPDLYLEDEVRASGAAGGRRSRVAARVLVAEPARE